jgi:DNA-binding SARP family transcriptional activator
MTLHLRLFGQLQAADASGAVVRVARPRAQRLLGYLLLHRRQSLTREHVAFVLWPDSPEDEAVGTLRRALSDLRISLAAAGPGDWIVPAGGALRWNRDAPCWIDVDEFERLVRQATPAALHRAVDLYAGDLLVDWVDEWVVAERDRLRDLQVTALRQLVAHHRALGDYAAAGGLARRALALDPLAEAIYRELMALHYQSGDRGAALAEYDRLRRRLREELDVEPMAATEAVRAAILQGAPLPADPAAAGGPAPPRPDRAPPPAPVGREAELAQLGALWERAADGHGRLVIVSGEAGVGKSHLARALTDHVVARGGLALVGHCYEFERALPYGAVVEMLRSAAPLLRHADLAPAHRAALARLAPDVLGVAGPPAAESEAPATDLRAQLFEALWQACLALARQQPVLLVVEDAHWAAESTLDWLTYVSPRLPAGRLLVTITYRADEIGSEHALARLRQRLARDGAVATFTLKPLSRDAHRELVARLSGLPAADAEPVADRLFEETGGNPFFLHELARGLTEAGHLAVHGGRWTGPLVDAAAGAAVPLPASLRDAINARIDRLAETSRQFIRAAAVAGRVFDFEIVQRVGDWADEPALTALEDLLARDLIRQGEAHGDYTFTHHLVQEALYAALAPPRRVAWRRRLVGALEVLRPDDIEALAHHSAEAGDHERARAYYRQAGDRAWRLLAPREAAAHYRAALDRWPATDGAGRAALLRKHAECLWLTGALAEAMAALDAARSAFAALGDREGAGAAERLIGRIYWELGRREESLRHYQRALTILEAGSESPELARAVGGIAQMHLVAFAFDETIAWGERALALAERLDVSDVIVDALNNLGVARTATGDPERGLAMLRESLERALALGLAHEATRAYCNLGELLIGEDRDAEARATFEAMLTFVQRAHAVKDGGWPLIWLAHLEWRAGEWAGGLARRRQYRDWARAAPASRRAHVWACSIFGRIDNDLGQAASARQLLEQELAAARDVAELQITAPFLGQLARAYALLGLDDEARTIAEEMLAWIDQSPYPQRDCTPLILWASRWFAGQPGGAAIAAARACVARLERAAAEFGNRETDGALAEGRGAVLLAAGDHARAADQFRAAVADWTASERPCDRARALVSLAGALSAAGDHAAAREAGEPARALVDALAAQLDDATLKRSFLDSPLGRAARAAGGAVRLLPEPDAVTAG